MDKIREYLIQNRDLFGSELFINSIVNTSKYDNYPVLNLNEFKESICGCKECPLGQSRTEFVFGGGDPNANLLLVGEAPGEQEDLKGEPFIGRAGKLLDKILLAIGLNRNKNVFITNVVKCRPPNNRDPLPSEVEKCEPYLNKQISLINPILIVALGRVAAKTLLKLEMPLKDLRDKIHDYSGIPLRVTYHPAALLRNPMLKKAAWEDFQWIQKYINNKS
tara:strand:+ start:11920 stop:12579 length:660 start_codon:yes stop_codon:yes gene_type:complete